MYLDIFIYLTILAPFDLKIGVRCSEAVPGGNLPGDIDTAKEVCYKDPSCTMFFSDRGDPRIFKKCRSPVSVIKSIANSKTNPTWEGTDLLYVKGNL